MALLFPVRLLLMQLHLHRAHSTCLPKGLRRGPAKADMGRRSHVHLVSIATARHFHLSWRW